MAKQAKQQPPVVAELGRPETPEETAARKAESSRLHRARQTFSNLIASLGVAILATFVIVWIVPRDDTPILLDVDYREAAVSAQAGIDEPLAAPTVPEHWSSNAATLRTGADGITEWYIGFIVNDDDDIASEYVGLSQGLQANATWVSALLDRRSATGELATGSCTWQVYDYLDLPADETGNTAYALVTERGASTFVLYGSHSAEQVQQLAQQLAAERCD